MPSSHAAQINEIVDLILLTNPASVLDIGVGLGKYGLLAREYLELWGQPLAGEWKGKPGWQRRIDGIEAYERYLNPVHHYIYNQIHIGNAIDVLPRLKERYDLVLLIDVLEHFEREDGLRLLTLCKQRASNLIVSTPRDIGHQEGSWGNPFETHRFQWTDSHFDPAETVFVPNDESLICYIGERVREARGPMRRAVLRSTILRQTPFFVKNSVRVIKRCLAFGRRAILAPARPERGAGLELVAKAAPASLASEGPGSEAEPPRDQSRSASAATTHST
jgi:hypothetical protein